MSLYNIGRVRQSFVEEGTNAAIERRKGSRYREPKFDGEKKAHLIALARSKCPEGQKRWTLRQLANTMVELNHIESLSYETVRQTLKKMSLKPSQRSISVFLIFRAALFVFVGNTHSFNAMLNIEEHLQAW